MPGFGMELLQRPGPLAGNHLAVARQGASLRIAHPAGLAGAMLSRRCSSIWKAPALAIDVRSWPEGPHYYNQVALSVLPSVLPLLAR